MTPLVDTKSFYAAVGIEPPPPHSDVLRGDNTIEEGDALRSEQIAEGVDRLFGPQKAYNEIKREKPTHRLILWMTLQGQKIAEIAVSVGCTEGHVRNVQKQPWFQDSFCKLAEEMGKDAVQTFLKGEVMPAILRTVELSKTADSDAVKLAANRDLLDRFLGKPVVKAEVKNSGAVDHLVFDANALLEEQRRNAEILKGRGIGSN